MPNIPELAPSRELLTQWQSNTIDWEEFRERFTDEMRAEYRKKESRLKGLIKYSLENDVTLHSPEPSGEQTYRAILEGIINVIRKSQGQTGHVTDLAREPVEEAQPQEDIANLFGNTLHKLNLTKGDNTRLLREHDELRWRIDQLEEKISNQQGEIQLLKDANCELEEQVNKREKTIDDFHRTLSKQKDEIQSLRVEGDQKDMAKSELQEEIDSLRQINATNAERIRSSNEINSGQEREIQSLKDQIGKKNRENDELKKQVAQFQDINTHPGIRDIAVKATGDDPVFGEYFRTLDIDKSLPETLRNWLIMHLRTDPNSRKRLPTLIREYADFRHLS